MINQNSIVPRISFKGVFTFMVLLFIGLLLIPTPLQLIGLSKIVSFFIAAGISSTIGSIVVLTKIDAKEGDKLLFKKRVLISFIIGFATSALMTFVFGGDMFG